jgi:RND superfamily putative drug exporter
MFRVLGQMVARFWPLLLLFWILIVAGVDAVAPAWDDVIQDGEFVYLPKYVPSRQGEELFRDAFSRDELGSSVWIVVLREFRAEGLLDTDKDTFIDGILEPRIELIQLLTDIAAACSPANSDPERTYANLNRLLSAVWNPAEDPWDVDADGNATPTAMQERKRVVDSIAAVLDAVRDWHADLFADEADPDPQTDITTSLRKRIGRQLEQIGIDRDDWSEPLRAELSTDVPQNGDSPGPQWEAPDGTVDKPEPDILRVRTFRDKSLGRLFESKDNKASLVKVELKADFLNKSNRHIIRKIEQLVGGNDLGQTASLHRERLIPPGLNLALSGSAMVGRDMGVNAKKSVDDTHFWMLVLVVILLLCIYRAPVLVLIPLATVYVSVGLALDLLACLARAGYVELFSGIEIYAAIVMCGAGIDYCMFLISRYKEELDGGATFDEATKGSIVKVGAALAASAGTTMCGIGMMVFAEFGKFRQAGVAMSFGLFFVLAASLTFTPALMRLFGRWAFWPHIRTERVAVDPAWVSPTSLIVRLLQRNWFGGLWDRVGQALLKRPGTIWLASVAVMMPFVVVAVVCFEHRSYGLLSELPPDETSVFGAKAVQRHFPPGQTGPITILLENQRVDFGVQAGRKAVEDLTRALDSRKQELRIADIRSIADPLGMRAEEEVADLSRLQRAFSKRLMRKRASRHYVSDKGDLAGHVTRIDVVLEIDPFSPESIDQFDRLRQAVLKEMPGELADDSRILYIGAIPSIRDLKTVTGRDQIRIDILVLASVFLILVLLLRKVAISGYLILSVFFSYLVTLGVTYTWFWASAFFATGDVAGFPGLDWKVPMFLFTILIAVGEDYNIYLITRIDEEQRRHGKIKGVIVALSKTGKIISSCGLIMAGTFFSLYIGGSLAAMRQLGFALGFGVLLDTFVVRPVLVPAYLILLYRGRFGFLGKFLGAGQSEHAPVAATVPLEVGGETTK